MDNSTEIKLKLDNYYQEYKDNKNTLNGSKTKEVAKYIVEIASLKDGNLHDVAVELARFSADVTNEFFTIITSTIPTETLDLLLTELQATDTDSRLSQYYVSKYAFAITSIMKCYKENAFKIAAIPQLVVFIARFAMKSDKNKTKFYNLINNTSGGIFILNYSGISRGPLVNIWNATNRVYLDLSKAKYSALIFEWAKKYGFIKDDMAEAHAVSDQAVKAEKVIASNETPVEAAKPTEVQASAPDSDTTSVQNGNTTAPSGETAQKLYASIKRDLTKEQETIITAFTDMITPIGKAFDTIQGEINKSREMGAENAALKVKISNLESQLSEQRTRLQTANQSLVSAKAENDELKKQISFLESRNSELDSELNDAYAINSRESSLEAEKIRSELKKAFAFLYEDWLEYEFSDVNEDNYESLQAIIKKIFRSLERNGINFKENN